MCGIAGIKLFNNLISKEEIERFSNALQKQSHRGPDNSKTLAKESILFGHNRLPIIDTNERSHQPFTNENNRYFLVFNGEIYNYKELKKTLKTEGCTFKTSSDTEVLFYLLIKYKEQALELLRGCFAFSFYDSEKDELLCARDRMGINPFLFYFDEKQFIFASELFVFEELNLNLNLNHQAINYYFQYTYIPAPLSIYSEIQKLQPGHFITIKNNKLLIKQYWSPRAESNYSGTYDNAKTILEERLNFAVQSQLEADVPLGTFLSGGVDSSIVSAIAKQQKEDLHTFSVAFSDVSSFDESKYAQLVANHIGSNHHVIKLDENDFKNNFNTILNSFDEPFADSSAIAMWFLAKETSTHLKVALSGDGADELLGGYNKHKAFLQSKKNSISQNIILKSNHLFPKLSSQLIGNKRHHKLNKFQTLQNLSWPNNYEFLASNIGKSIKNELLIRNTYTNIPVQINNESFNEFLLLDQLMVLPNDMLKKVDLMSMAHSLEVRTPFMDKDLVKFINSLPQEFKYKNGIGKSILRDTYKEYLPIEIFTRSKQGFEVPLNKWIKKNWNTLIPEKWFDKNKIEEQQLFDYNYVNQLKKDFFNNKGTSNQAIWAYLVFQNWYFKRYA